MPQSPRQTYRNSSPFVPVSNAVAIQMNSSSGTHPPAAARRKTRRRRSCGGAPSTPLLHWTFYNTNNEKKKHHRSSSRAGAGDGAKFSGGRYMEQSARKLAAGLWRLRLSAGLLRCGIGGFSSRRRSSDRLRFGPRMANVNMMLPLNHSSKEYSSDTKHQLRRSQSIMFGPKQGTLHKLESLFQHSKSLKEGATKWDGRGSKASIEAYCFVSHMKLLEDQVKTVSFVSALQAELVQAQLYIHDLEYEVRSSRNRVKYLIRKLGEERTSSEQKKEHDNIYALIDDLKGQLSRERKKQQKKDVINSQLVKELAEAKLSAMQLVQKYEEEKRSRKLLEEVCNELAMKIGEDKAEVEALRIETMKIREEVEEERNMLQVAEDWREERVQMKLIDAKLVLESKYSQMNKLITVLETFLRSRSTSLDVTELRKAELMIGQAVKAVSIQDMEEFSYEPMRSGDIFSILEELLQVEVCEREIKPCFNYSSTGDVSHYHIVSPQKNYHDNETAARVSPNTETSEVCSLSAGQSKWKTSSAKLCGSYKAISDEGNGRLSSGTFSSLGRNLPNRKSIKDGLLKHQKPMGQCSSLDLVNPHIARGMKGSIEWPRGFEKNTLKAKLSEARTESEKAQWHRHNTSQQIGEL